MTVGGGAPVGPDGEGARGNGLPAQAFEPLVDLEPELAAAMLAVFREEGVAARVSEVEPKGAEDRVWVDASELDLARAVLHTRLPILRAEQREREIRESDAKTVEAARESAADGADGPDPDGPDPGGPVAADGGAEEAPGPDGGGTPAPFSAAEQAAWEELVAVFDEPSAEPPDRPDAGRITGVGGVPFNPKPLPVVRPLPKSGPGSGPRDHTPAEDEEDEHFEPPEPEPLPESDTTTKLSWVAVLGGPALLLFLTVFRPGELTDWPAVLGVLLFVGGFIALVVRMKDDDEDDDDPDDGAVV